MVDHASPPVNKVTASLGAFAQGLALGGSLIVAIGAQNAFVLRQGLARRQVALVATICFLCDAGLIALGVLGLGAAIAGNAALRQATAWGGAAFIAAYGLRALWRMRRPEALAVAGAAEPRAAAVAAQALAFSLLNPHVYLDTVVLIGSVAAQVADASRAWFAIGAAAASALWFYGLGYGATRLAPLFRTPAAWRALDALIGAVMLAIAVGLVAASFPSPPPAG
jgi:L-lysine exporter family protein LysE/ArgO